MVNDIPTDLMASRIINAAGTLTRLSGARVSPAVAAAMSQAAQSSFDMWALQAAASTRIAQATGAEAGLVTTGASAGLTLAAAAAIAGFDVARMQALPFTGDIPNEILVPRTHRNGYDRAITVAGAKLIDIGTADRQTDAGLRGLEAWEIETAIGPKTVALLGNASGATEQDLPLLADIAARHRSAADCRRSSATAAGIQSAGAAGSRRKSRGLFRRQGDWRAAGVGNSGRAARSDCVRRTADARHGCATHGLRRAGRLLRQQPAIGSATTRNRTRFQSVERGDCRVDGGAGGICRA